MNDFVNQLLDGGVFESNVPHITESGLKEKIRNGSGKRLSFSEHETPLLAKFISLLESDPFRNGPAFNKDDLDGMGLDVKGGVDSVDDIASEGEPDRRVSNIGKLPDGMLNIDQAIMAPNATPGHDEPIPDSVLHAMDVISGLGKEQAVPASMYDDEQPTTVGNQQSFTAEDDYNVGEEDAEINPETEEIAARLVNGVSEGFSVSSKKGDPGLDPGSLAETMRKLRGQKTVIQEAASARQQSLESIAASNRRGGGAVHSDAFNRAAASIAQL